MTIWISQELPLFNFKRLDILCVWIRPPCKKLWPFEFLESIRCSTSSVSIYYVPESVLRVKSYDHLNFSRACSISSVSIYYSPKLDLRVKSNDHLNISRASVNQFRASRYIMRLNLTSVWKVMTIWISWELPSFNSERLDILCAWIGCPSEKLWPFEFLESVRCSMSSVSIYYAPESDLCVKSYDHLNFSRACSISSASIYYAPESDLRVKSYEHLNCSRASIVQFRATRYIMRAKHKLGSSQMRKPSQPTL